MPQVISERFAHNMKYSHKIAIKVEIFEDGVLMKTFESRTTRVISGEVNVEESGERNARVTIVDPDGQFIPHSFQSIFWFGREMRCYRGIEFLDGTKEYVLLGVFRLYEVRVTSSRRNRVMTLRGRDRADRVRRTRFTDVYEVAAGTNVAVAVRTLLEGAGITQFNFTPTASTTRKMSFQRGGDRWDAALEIAEGAGFMLRFDAQGVAVMEVVPHPNERPVSWYYDTTKTDTHPIISVERTGTDENVYNHIIITGEGDKNIVRAEAKDTDPNSETYYLGEFGDVTFFRVVSANTSQADAQRLADQLLAAYTRSTEKVAISILANPAIDINDIVYVREDMSRTNSRFVVSNFSIPFEKGSTMTLNMNVRRSAILADYGA